MLAFRVVQFAPPSVVFNAVPHSPTARQIVVLGQLTDSRPFAGGGIPAHQWTPPSVVKAMAPALAPPPTATQAVEVAQLIAMRAADRSGGTWALQMAPPLVVDRMLADSPTAKQAETVGQLIP
ncbi:MAG: hypothetical protein E6J53_07105 [Chloroflexi bacterium]|nr:MAG: hypothetical protein E6J53_07105 [Chloroflexota bacterium]